MLANPVFSRPIDQALYDRLTALPDSPSENDYDAALAEARNLIARGADINAKAIKSTIPEARLLACVLEGWSYGLEKKKAALIRLSLESGFDPTLDNGLNGALTLAHFIKLSFPNVDFLPALKTLLRAGCDPSIECFLFDDEPLPKNALDYAFDELCDVFLIDHDLTLLLGLATAWSCIKKRLNNGNFETVGFVTESFGSVILAVRTFGGIRIESSGKGLWKFQKNRVDPFSAGLILITRNNCICIDPDWGAFCDPELKNVPFDADIDLDIKGLWLHGLRGKVWRQPLFRFLASDSARQSALVIDGDDKLIRLEKDEFGLSDACELMMPGRCRG